MRGYRCILRGVTIAAALLALAPATPAGGVTIASQGFNDDGTGSPIMVFGGGTAPGDPDDFWGFASIGGPLGFTGQEGADYFAGRDLNGNIDTDGDGNGDGDLDPRSVEVGSIDISGQSNVQVALLIAAFPGEWEAVAEDYIRIWAVDLDTGGRTLLDEFLADAPGNANLTSQGGTDLGLAFQEFVYDVPGGIDSLAVLIEAHSTGNLESMGFDDLRVTAPEPATAITFGLGLGLLALQARRAGRARRQSQGLNESAARAPKR